jgi:hypothetical protein
MELNERERAKIVAEECLRMETRKEYMRVNIGGMRGMCPWGGGRGMHGFHGCCHGGFVLLRLLFLGLALFGLYSLWHHTPCGHSFGGDGAPRAATVQVAPVQ